MELPTIGDQIFQQHNEGKDLLEAQHSTGEDFTLTRQDAWMCFPPKCHHHLRVVLCSPPMFMVYISPFLSLLLLASFDQLKARVPAANRRPTDYRTCVKTPAYADNLKPIEAQRSSGAVTSLPPSRNVASQ
ncbi:uncharacterized [Tachysurus ichikawai]